MNLLPKASGTRPRVACDISPQGVVAARSVETGGPLTAVARVELAEGAVMASLKPGNIVDRVAVTAAVRKAMEAIGERANSHGSDITLVVPDAAVRVLLLEFDALPSKLTESLPIVRFRLKKMLPFDADHAMVSFQVMSSSKTMVRVLAVAIPPDVLSEYETAAREAGFEPGAVIPSTLAALAAVEDESPTLLINATELGVTAAIVHGGILLLHRSVDLQPEAMGTPANLPPALFEATVAEEVRPMGEIAPEETTGEWAGEWAVQPALDEPGRSGAYEPGGTLQDGALQDGPAQPEALGEEIAQAVSVAAAYFEDTLAMAPSSILSAGPLGAEALGRIVAQYGVEQADGLRVRELVETDALLPEAATAGVPRGWMSGVLGALRG